MKSKIELKQGDLTEMEVDAIVNAANNDLILGGGVAGAIRRKGGEEIQEECNRIGTIPVGQAAVTGAGKLKAKFVIHAASMSLGGWTTKEGLLNSVRNTFRIVAEKKINSIALPAIGTGIAAFPVDRCAQIMIDEALAHLKGNAILQKVYFVLYDAKTLAAFKEYFSSIPDKQP
ncbi:MAG: macro domain-containing protein [Planctomycetota bacterium]|nr:macro domain-containing protein [Planctomycetota bacterium]